MGIFADRIIQKLLWLELEKLFGRSFCRNLFDRKSYWM
jgi:hypothetical protein